VKLLARAAAPDGVEPALRLKAIEALGKIGSTPARECLYPLLDEDGELRDAVAHAVARTGNAAVAYIRRAMPDASPPKKRTLLRVLSALRTPEAMDLLLDVLADPHAGTAREAVSIFKEEAGALESKESKALSAQVRAALAKSGFARAQVTTEAAIQLLTHLRDPASAKLLLAFSSRKHPPAVRRAALQGLRWVLPEQGEHADAVGELLEFLEEEDFQNIVSPALDVVLPLDVPASAAKRLIALAESRHPLVRKFALTKMSGLDQIDVTRVLVHALSDSDPMIRELASRSLREQPGAWKVVVEALESVKDVDLAWRMVHAVDPRKAKAATETLRVAMKQLIDRLEAMDPIAEPALNLVQSLDPGVHYDVLHERARLHKRRGRFREAELCLRPLMGNETCSDEVRFELAVVALKNADSSAGTVARDSDIALRLIKGLVKTHDFPVLKKLLAERTTLEPGDFYYLGFHLVEGSPEERVVGTALLHHLVDETARSKVGRSARSKLHLEGLL
jgi:HEAT repeat protein